MNGEKVNISVEASERALEGLMQDAVAMLYHVTRNNVEYKSAVDKVVKQVIQLEKYKEAFIDPQKPWESKMLKTYQFRERESSLRDTEQNPHKATLKEFCETLHNEFTTNGNLPNGRHANFESALATLKSLDDLNITSVSDTPAFKNTRSRVGDNGIKMRLSYDDSDIGNSLTPETSSGSDENKYATATTIATVEQKSKEILQELGNTALSMIYGRARSEDLEVETKQKIYDLTVAIPKFRELIDNSRELEIDVTPESLREAIAQAKQKKEFNDLKFFKDFLESINALQSHITFGNIIFNISADIIKEVTTDDISKRASQRSPMKAKSQIRVVEKSNGERELKEKISELEAEKSKLEEKVSELSIKLEQHAEEIERIKDELTAKNTELEEQNKDLHDANRELQTHNASQEREFDAAKSALESDIENLRSKHEKAFEEAEQDHKKEVSSLQAEREQEIESLKKDHKEALEKIEAELVGLQDYKVTTIGSVVRLEGELDDANAKLEEVETELEKEKQKHEKELEEVLKGFDEFDEEKKLLDENHKAELEEKYKEIASLKAEHESTLEMYHDATRKEMAELQTGHEKELTCLKEEHEQKAKEIEESLRGIELAHGTLKGQDKEDRIAALEDELDRVSGQYKEANTRIDDLNIAADNLMKENIANNEMLEKLRVEKLKLQHKFDELRGEKHTLEEQNQALTKQIQEQEEQFKIRSSSIADSLAQVQGGKNTLEDDLDKVQRANAALEQKNVELNAQLKQQEHFILSITEDKEKLEKQLDEAQEALRGVNQRVDDDKETREEIDKLKRDLAASKKETSEALNTVKEKDSNILRAIKSNAELERERSQANERMQKTSGELVEVNKKLEELGQRFTAALHKRMEDDKKHETEINDLTAQLKRSEAAVASFKFADEKARETAEQLVEAKAQIEELKKGGAKHSAPPSPDELAKAKEEIATLKDTKEAQAGIIKKLKAQVGENGAKPSTSWAPAVSSYMNPLICLSASYAFSVLAAPKLLDKAIVRFGIERLTSEMVHSTKAAWVGTTLSFMVLAIPHGGLRTANNGSMLFYALATLAGTAVDAHLNDNKVSKMLCAATLLITAVKCGAMLMSPTNPSSGLESK